MKYTTVVSETVDSPAILQYLAPYTSATLVKFFMYSRQHALIIYDDHSKHAEAYRPLNLHQGKD